MKDREKKVTFNLKLYSFNISHTTATDVYTKLINVGVRLLS